MPPEKERKPGAVGTCLRPPPLSLLLVVVALLAAEECDNIIAGAQPRLERSGVKNIDEAKGINEVVHPDFRTSYNMFYNRGENEVVKGGWGEAWDRPARRHRWCL